MVSLVNTFGKLKEIMFLEKKKSFINMLKLYLKINNIQKIYLQPIKHFCYQKRKSENGDKHLN